MRHIIFEGQEKIKLGWESMSTEECDIVKNPDMIAGCLSPETSEERPR